MTYNNVMLRKFHLKATNGQREFDRLIFWAGFIATSYRNTEAPPLVDRIKSTEQKTYT